jgi:hypothetical protein
LNVDDYLLVGFESNSNVYNNIKNNYKSTITVSDGATLDVDGKIIINKESVINIDADSNFSAGTIGLNLRAESNQADCLVQTYAAAAGTNHRSFWTLDVVSDDIITGMVLPVPNSTADMPTYDLLGRRTARGSSGIHIQQGKKYLRK